MFLDYYNLQPLFMAIHAALRSIMPEGLAIFLEGLVVGVMILVLYAVLAIILIYMERKVCAASSAVSVRTVSVEKEVCFRYRPT